MGLVIAQSGVKPPMSLASFISYMDETLDFNSDTSIDKCKNTLAQLYNNRTFLIEYIIRAMSQGLSGFESHNRYNPPSIILAEREKYILRANIWRPTSSFNEGDVNVYGLAHDHNFNFLTLNYWGSGYFSEMYEYDYNSVIGIPGEKCTLINNGLMNLSEGDIYLYRKNLDIHRQLPPRSATITINVMEKIDLRAHSKQYVFDLHKREIKSVYGEFFSKKHVYEMAKIIGGDEINSHLKRVRDTTNCDMTVNILGG